MARIRLNARRASFSTTSGVRFVTLKVTGEAPLATRSVETNKLSTLTEAADDLFDEMRQAYPHEGFVITHRLAEGRAPNGYRGLRSTLRSYDPGV